VAPPVAGIREGFVAKVAGVDPLLGVAHKMAAAGALLAAKGARTRTTGSNTGDFYNFQNAYITHLKHYRWCYIHYIYCLICRDVGILHLKVGHWSGVIS